MPGDNARIYEGTSVTAKARIPSEDVEFVEEVAFKFLKDGEQFEEKTVAVPQPGADAGGDAAEGDTGSDAKDEAQAADSNPAIISHTVEAPVVPDDKDCYLLNYHFFFKVKSGASASQPLQDMSFPGVYVFPRTAQLKVTWDKDDKPFHQFEFQVVQNGKPSGPQHTLAVDGTNAKGETIPAGSAEFNLGLFPGFRIMQSSPYEISEEVVDSGRKREVKGDLKFRAVFVAPEKGKIRQYVNYDVENLGQTGLGHAVTVEVGVHPEDQSLGQDNTSAEVPAFSKHKPFGRTRSGFRFLDYNNKRFGKGGCS